MYLKQIETAGGVQSAATGGATGSRCNQSIANSYTGLIRAKLAAMIPIDFRIKVFGIKHLDKERKLKDESPTKAQGEQRAPVFSGT
jgi:hypothetical protein